MCFVIGIIISYRGVIPAVWCCIYDAICIIGDCVIGMPRPVDIPPVQGIDIPGIMRKMPEVVIVYHQSAYLCEVTVVITDKYISGPCDTSVVVVINRNIFYLDNRSVSVVLYIRIIVIARIKTDRNPGRVDTYPRSPVTEVGKIELSVGIDREFNISFRENIGIPAVETVISRSFRRGFYARTQEHKHQ